MIPLLNEEAIITKSGDEAIVLTNLRLTKQTNSDTVSIGVDKISCIKIHYTSNLFFLFFGVFGLLGGVVSFIADFASEGFVVTCFGAVFILLFIFSRRHIVSVFSDSGQSIDFSTKGLSKKDVVGFMTKIDQARTQFAAKYSSI